MNKTLNYLIKGGLIALLIAGVIYWWQQPGKKTRTQKVFTVEYQNVILRTFSSEKNTIGEALEEVGFTLLSETKVFPDREEMLKSGTNILVVPAQQVTIEVDGEKKELLLPAETIGEALEQSGIHLNEADIVTPSKETLLSDKQAVEIIRVTITEETEEKKIPFKKVEVEDDTLSWQTKKVTQKGEAGVLKQVYEVSRHNNRVVQKKLLREEVAQEPVEEKTVVGTKVTVIKKHNGAASWYAHTGTLSAANPWLPFGSYVRVTNKANGKSVIVRINDRGPFGPGRIIDLDKVAFAKIADLGTGVVDVLMEEIK